MGAGQDQAPPLNRGPAGGLGAAGGGRVAALHADDAELAQQSDMSFAARFEHHLLAKHRRDPQLQRSNLLQGSSGPESAACMRAVALRILMDTGGMPTAAEVQAANERAPSMARRPLAATAPRHTAQASPVQVACGFDDPERLRVFVNSLSERLWRQERLSGSTKDFWIVCHLVARQAVSLRDDGNLLRSDELAQRGLGGLVPRDAAGGYRVAALLDVCHLVTVYVQRAVHRVCMVSSAREAQCAHAAAPPAQPARHSSQAPAPTVPHAASAQQLQEVARQRAHAHGPLQPLGGAVWPRSGRTAAARVAGSGMGMQACAPALRPQVAAGPPAARTARPGAHAATPPAQPARYGSQAPAPAMPHAASTQQQLHDVARQRVHAHGPLQPLGGAVWPRSGRTAAARVAGPGMGMQACAPALRTQVAAGPPAARTASPGALQARVPARQGAGGAPLRIRLVKPRTGPTNCSAVLRASAAPALTDSAQLGRRPALGGVPAARPALLATPQVPGTAGVRVHGTAAPSPADRSMPLSIVRTADARAAHVLDREAAASGQVGDSKIAAAPPRDLPDARAGHVEVPIDRSAHAPGAPSTGLALAPSYSGSGWHVRPAFGATAVLEATKGADMSESAVEVESDAEMFAQMRTWDAFAESRSPSPSSSPAQHGAAATAARRATASNREAGAGPQSATHDGAATSPGSDQQRASTESDGAVVGTVAATLRTASAGRGHQAPSGSGPPRRRRQRFMRGPDGNAKPVRSPGHAIHATSRKQRALCPAVDSPQEARLSPATMQEPQLCALQRSAAAPGPLPPPTSQPATADNVQPGVAVGPDDRLASASTAEQPMATSRGADTGHSARAGPSPRAAPSALMPVTVKPLLLFNGSFTEGSDTEPDAPTCEATAPPQPGAPEQQRRHADAARDLPAAPNASPSWRSLASPPAAEVLTGDPPVSPRATVKSAEAVGEVFANNPVTTPDVQTGEDTASPQPESPWQRRRPASAAHDVPAAPRAALLRPSPNSQLAAQGLPGSPRVSPRAFVEAAETSRANATLQMLRNRRRCRTREPAQAHAASARATGAAEDTAHAPASAAPAGVASPASPARTANMLSGGAMLQYDTLLEGSQFDAFHLSAGILKRLCAPCT